MSFAVMIPLHSDATVFAGKELCSDDLVMCMDGIESALAEWLAPAVREEWPELKLLYVDCMLTNVQGADPKSVQFKKARGQLTAGCSVDCAPLFSERVEIQAIALFDQVHRACTNGFSKFKKTALLASLSKFKSQLDVDFVKANRKAADSDAKDDQDDIPHKIFPLDAEGRLRSTSKLPGKKGELWIMLKAPRSWSPDDLVGMVEDIEANVVENDLGEPEGSSFGTSICDASFDVRNLSRASKALDAYLRKTFPEVDFVISDDYEVAFDSSEEQSGATAE